MCVKEKYFKLVCAHEADALLAPPWDPSSDNPALTLPSDSSFHTFPVGGQGYLDSRGVGGYLWVSPATKTSKCTYVRRCRCENFCFPMTLEDKTATCSFFRGGIREKMKVKIAAMKAC